MFTRFINQTFPLASVLKAEFSGYDGHSVRADLLAGITVAAVALPLALAFGVASGVTASAGLVTAILAGLLIGGLGGAGFQISGPTGAMSAVLIVLASRYGLEGVWMAGVLAGLFILLMGLFNLGRLVNVIPTSVLAGFTSGIAVIIFIGQIDNLLGIESLPAENAAIKVLELLQHPPTPNPAALGISLGVALLMILWPKSWNARFPASLLGLILATSVSWALGLDVPTIGAIPRSILLDARLIPSRIPWEHLGELVGPALSIAALGAIESLLCGTVGAKMTGERMSSRQELIAQGLGNVVIPFFGGVPATAAIARSSVAIKSGGRTRMTSVIHALTLLLVALLFAPLLSRVPLSALAGVLAVTAYRMNDWTEIRQIFRWGFKSAIIVFAVTLIATVALDLTQAIIVGVGLSALGFVFQISAVSVNKASVDVKKLKESGHIFLSSDPDRFKVVYMIGPLFFGSAPTFNDALEDIDGHDLILSLRTVPLIDVTGLVALETLIERVHAGGGEIYLSGLNPAVQRYFERSGLIEKLGEHRIFWSAFEAIVAADAKRAMQDR